MDLTCGENGQYIPIEYLVIFFLTFGSKVLNNDKRHYYTLYQIPYRVFMWQFLKMNNFVTTRYTFMEDT